VQIICVVDMPPSRSTGEHWQTLAKQPFCSKIKGVHRLTICVAKKRGDKAKLWTKVYMYSTDWKPGGWATEAAALAARAQFKHWVDYERNVPKRTAQAEAAASRSTAALDALLRPPAPTRATLCGVHTGSWLRQRGAEPIFRDPVIITFDPK
jgi:hypothetical protein